MDVMVDIETLGKRPGCVVLEIAAIRFDPHARGATGDGGEREPDAEFHAFVDVAEQLRLGQTIDGDTWSFWTRNRERFVERVLPTGTVRPLRSVLNDFYIFCRPMLTERFWARGVNFDYPILEDLYRTALPNVVPPWMARGVHAYRNLHELRTALSLFDHAGTRNEQSHTALGDCRNQVADLRRCVRLASRQAG